MVRLKKKKLKPGIGLSSYLMGGLFMKKYRVVGFNNGKWIIQESFIEISCVYGTLQEEQKWKDIPDFEGFGLSYLIGGVSSKEEAIELAEELKDHKKGIPGCTCPDMCQFMFDDAINRMKSLERDKDGNYVISKVDKKVDKNES